MKSIIKLAEKSNAGDIVELLNKVTLYLHGKGINQWVYPWNLSEIERDIEEKNTYKVTIDNLVIGSFSLNSLDNNLWSPEIKTSSIYLYRIAILPEFQGKNIGLQIIDYAYQYAKNTKKILYLDCWSGNKKLRNFYMNAGFEFCGDFPEEDYMISVFKKDFHDEFKEK